MLGGVVLAIPRYSKPHSKREEWNDFERDHRAATWPTSPSCSWRSRNPSA
jgi:hypothetical protein